MTAATDGLYFANMGVITVAGSGGTPASKTLAVVKNVKASVKWDEVLAYGWGSLDIQGRAKMNQKVDVEIEYIKFAPKVGEWWPYYIGDSAAGAGTITDTNKVTLFTVTALFEPIDATGTVKVLRTITGVSFSEFPLEAKEGQWLPVNMKGVGTTVVDTNPA
jgi:hypothetical protein